MREETNWASLAVIEGERLIPFGDSVIVLPIEESKASEGGIVFSIDGTPPTRGRVLALGRGPIFRGRLFPYDFKVGDIVWFDRYAGVEQKCRDTGRIIRFLKGGEIAMVEDYTSEQVCAVCDEEVACE